MYLFANPYTGIEVQDTIIDNLAMHITIANSIKITHLSNIISYFKYACLPDGITQYAWLSLLIT